MDKTLEILLVEKYPKIFAEYHLSPKESCMGRGFECGNGWYDIIDRFCGAIQDEVRWTGGPQVIATQVKQKLGGLRFYYELDAPEDAYIDSYYKGVIRGLVNGLAIAGYSICEKCGSNSNVETKTTTEGHYIQTLCQDCQHKKQFNELVDKMSEVE